MIRLTVTMFPDKSVKRSDSPNIHSDKSVERSISSIMRPDKSVMPSYLTNICSDKSVKRSDSPIMRFYKSVKHSHFLMTGSFWCYLKLIKNPCLNWKSETGNYFAGFCGYRILTDKRIPLIAKTIYLYLTICYWILKIQKHWSLCIVDFWLQKPI